MLLYECDRLVENVTRFEIVGAPGQPLGVKVFRALTPSHIEVTEGVVRRMEPEGIWYVPKHLWEASTSCKNSGEPKNRCHC
jgi:hypothetical protein